MDRLVSTSAKLMFPLIVVFGVYVALHGHISPGGGFAAGAIIATAYALVLLCKRKTRIKHNLMHVLKCTSGAAMLAIVLFGHVVRGKLMLGQVPFTLWSGGFTPLLNVIGCVMVTVSMVIAIYLIMGD